MKIPQEIIHQLQNKKICILGLGREGMSTYKFLRSLLPDQELTLADQSILKGLNPKIQKQITKDTRVKLQLGPDYLSELNKFELIFKTPGISLNQPAIKQAIQAGVKITSNLQLFLEIIEINKTKFPMKSVKIADQNSKLYQPIVIGVTGTKGKSTTSALIYHLLKKNKIDTIFVGNIGQPALNQIDHIKSKSTVVIELSSHQLEQLSISPDIAVILEIKSEHLDYFPNEQAYIDSKKSITRYQKVNQYTIYNPQWSKTKEIANLSPGKKLKFQVNLTKNTNINDILVYLKSYYLTFNDTNVEEQIIHVDDIPLVGKHNLENVAPAIIIGKIFQLTTQQIASAIKSFKPLAHRLEKVAIKNGVTYINDSMATTPEATISAISCFVDQPIILLAGGHEKNQDFEPLAEKILTSNIKAIALFSSNGKRLWNEILKKQQQLKIEKLPQRKVVESMNEAMEFAKEQAQAGDVILLAPGSSSFGIFKDYADRGEQFRVGI